MRKPTWKITWWLVGVSFVAGSLFMWFLLSILGAQVCKISVGPIQLNIPCEEKVEVPPCYGLKITSPSSGASVDESVNVSGYYSDKPPDGSILLIFQSDSGENYWPQSPIVDDPQAKTWQGTFILGSGSRAYAAVGVMGKNTRTLIEYYRKIGNETGRWPAIEKFPEDFVICDRVLLSHK